MSPMGVQEQKKLNPDGSRTPANRATHDLSFATEREWSINGRVEADKLDPLVYGFALTRFFHVIVTLRLRYPGIALLLSKSDFKAAFRRIQTCGELPAQSAITTKGLGPLADQATENPNRPLRPPSHIRGSPESGLLLRHVGSSYRPRCIH